YPYLPICTHRRSISTTKARVGIKKSHTTSTTPAPHLATGIPVSWMNEAYLPRPCATEHQTVMHLSILIKTNIVSAIKHQEVTPPRPEQMEIQTFMNLSI